MKIVAFILISLLCSGCLNSFESEIVGSYSVDSFKVVDNKALTNKLPQLSLLKNKTFIFSYKNRNYRGNWSAYDDGDHTLIDLKGDGLECQGVVGVNEIIFDNPFELNMPNFKYLSFCRGACNIPVVK